MSFAPNINPTSSVQSRYKRRKRSSAPALLGLLMLTGAVAAAGWWFLLHRSIELAQLAPQRIVELKPFQLQITPKLKNVLPGDAKFSLDNPPEGAKIDPQTGLLKWTPSEAQGPGDFTLGVRVSAAGDASLAAVQPLVLSVDEVNLPPVVEALPDQELRGATTLTVQVVARDDDLPRQEIKYGLLAGALKGISINEHTGTITWAPKSVPTGVNQPVTVQVTDAAKKSATIKFNLRVYRDQRPLEKLLAAIESKGIAMKMAGRELAPLLPVASKVYEFGGDRLVTYEWDDSQPPASEMLKNLGDRLAAQPGRVYSLERLVVIHVGSHEALGEVLQNELGTLRNFATTSIPKSMPTSTPIPAAKPIESAPVASEFITKVRELYDARRLFVPREYNTLRKLFAEDFAKRHEETIKVALGADHADMMAWFDKHVDVKEDFFTAIHPKHDKVAECFSLFNMLRKQFPKPMENYGQLAIAMSVVWDDRAGLFTYDHQAERTHATMPAKMADAADNFKYLVDAEPIMQGRIRYMPWEFLTLIVNHNTPVVERQWALQKYLAQRSMFGACYGEVPYDHEMLKTESKVCKLDGKEYSLANILQFGGVCAQQADFAARVGKSLGVPAMYVTGAAQDGGLHAWVMWIELKQVTATNIVFSLESHGRYFGDKYYVGKLRDPQTGQQTTDRALELAMQNVGVNPLGRRHAALVMRAYPELRSMAELPIDKQLQFLSDVLKFSPGNEAAWTALSVASKGQKLLPAQEKMMVAAIDNLFRTFAKFPDFTWELFADLISFQPDVKQHIGNYEKLTQMYLLASRPDLACEAGLRWADLLVADGRQVLAIEGLAAAVMKFPEEGRYVPKMLDRIESAAEGLKGGGDALVQFYSAFLPKVPQTRGGDPTDHCKAMYVRAITLFRRLNRDDLATRYEAELAKLNAKSV